MKNFFQTLLYALIAIALAFVFFSTIGYILLAVVVIFIVYKVYRLFVKKPPATVFYTKTYKTGDFNRGESSAPNFSDFNTQSSDTQNPFFESDSLPETFTDVEWHYEDDEHHTPPKN